MTRDNLSWWQLLICLLLICGAIISGIKYFEMRTKESYIIGNIEDKWTIDTFRYNSKSIVFNKHEDKDNEYFYKTKLDKLEFNGEKNTYKIYLNDKPIIKSNITAGAVYFENEEVFKDTNSQIITNAVLKVSVRFLNDRTEMELICIGEIESAFYSQLISDKGFFLKILEVKE